MLAFKYAVSHAIRIQSPHLHHLFPLSTKNLYQYSNYPNSQERKEKSENYKSAALLTRVYFHGSFQHPPGSFGLVQTSGRTRQTSSHKSSTRS